MKWKCPADPQEAMEELGAMQLEISQSSARMEELSERVKVIMDRFIGTAGTVQ